MARTDRGRKRMWRFRLNEGTILEVSAPEGPTEKQVRRRGRVSLALGTLLATAAVAAVASADTVTPDGDTVTVGNQAIVNLGTVAPGAVLTPQTSFLLNCTGKQHPNEGQTLNLTFNLAGSTVPSGGSLSATNASIGSIPASWPDDTTGGGSTNCGATPPDPIQDNGNSTVTITAPTSTGATSFVVKWDFSLSPVSTSGDDSSAIVGSNTTVTYNLTVEAASNGAPLVGAGGPYSGAEGSNIAINGASATDPDNDSLSYSWTKDESGIVDGGSCILTAPLTLSPTLNCNENGSVTLTLTVDDGNGHTPNAQATVNVSNADPSATPGIPSSDVNEGDSFNLSLSSPTDPGSNDTFTYQFDCGDGAGYNAASTTASRSCPTTDNGSRSVALKILDDDGGSAEYTGTVTVVNVDPTVAAPLFQVASIGCRTSVTLSRIGFNDPGADADWTVEIDWDDGSMTSYDTAVKGVQPIQTHQYDTPGTYMATVTITDKDGGVGSNTSSNNVEVLQTYSVDFLPPFDDSTPSGLIVNKMKNGRVVPVKATIYDDCTLSFVTDPNADVTIRTSKTSGTGTGDPIEEYADAGQSSSGTNEFRWSDDGFWIYGLDSKALGLVVNNLYRVDIWVGAVKATVANWAVLQPVK